MRPNHYPVFVVSCLAVGCLTATSAPPPPEVTVPFIASEAHQTVELKDPAGSSKITSITTGAFTTCALSAGHNLLCWGMNRGNQLGTGTSGHTFAPTLISGLRDVRQVGIGLAHQCALSRGGAVFCWGDSGRTGLLGSGQETAPLPGGLTPVVSLPEAKQLAAGTLHTCALSRRGQIFCWGDVALGYTPTPSPGPALIGVVSLHAGDHLNCAILEQGELTCWPARADDPKPRRVVGLNDVTAVSLNWGQNCAVHSGGRVSCFEIGDWRDFGPELPSQDAQAVPVPGVTSVTAVSSGGEHVCALHQDGRITCWGSNNRGQLGNGERFGEQNPQAVVGVDDAIAVEAGNEHSCALRRDGRVSCWGSGQFGQLGFSTDKQEKFTTNLGGSLVPQDVEF